MDFELDLDEYERLTDLIYRKAGIRFENKKFYFLSKRVQKRMEITGMDTPSEYIRFLRFRDRDGSSMRPISSGTSPSFRHLRNTVFRRHCRKRPLRGIGG